MNTKKILTIIALSSLGLCLLCGLSKYVLQKGKKECDIACCVLILLSVILLVISQLIVETYKAFSPDLTILDGVISYKYKGGTMICDTGGDSSVIDCHVMHIPGNSWEQGCQALNEAGIKQWGWGNHIDAKVSQPSACENRGIDGEQLFTYCKDESINEQCYQCNALGIVTFTTPNFATVPKLNDSVVQIITTPNSTNKTTKITGNVIKYTPGDDSNATLIVKFMSDQDKNPLAPDIEYSTLDNLTINGESQKPTKKIGSITGCAKLCAKVMGPQGTWCPNGWRAMQCTGDWGQNCTMPQ